MPKTAAKFGQELQTSLQPMIIKPSGGGGIQVLSFHFPASVVRSTFWEDLAGNCGVHVYCCSTFDARFRSPGQSCQITQWYDDSDFMLYFLATCSSTARLQQFLQAPATKELTPNELRALLVLILIVSLLGENCNFDRLRQENSCAYPTTCFIEVLSSCNIFAALAPDIDSISKVILLCFTSSTTNYAL